MPKQLTPQEVANLQNWRKVDRVETAQAHNLRARLADAEVYPPQECSADDNEFHIAVIKAELPAIVEAMDYTDLLALHRAARLLAAVPRKAGLFNYIARNMVLTLARHGIDARDRYDVKALEVAGTVKALLAHAARQ